MMIGYTSNNSLNERDCFNPFKITAKHEDGGQGIISMVPFLELWGVGGVMGVYRVEIDD